jgi:3-hydroxyacyl-CoA dehydrogenase
LIRDKAARGELGAKAGKGFYDWSPARTASVIQRRDEALLELVGWLRARGFLGTESAGADSSRLSHDGEPLKGKLE